jgi:glycosyltransferase involved in cell wall biosynthesis
MFISWLFRTTFRVAYYHTLSSMAKLDSSLINYYSMKRRSLTYSLVTDIIFVSKYACSDFKFFHPIKKPRFNIVHNGIPDRNPGQVEITPQKTEIKNYNYLGRIDKSKGIMELVEAFILLHQKNPLIKLNISGGGKQADELKQRIKGLDFIKYLGKIPYEKVDKFLQESYFNIFPSRLDNLPTVVIESLMNGTPVITSNKGGIPEMVTEGYNGFLFDSHEVKNINSAIEKSFNLTEEEYKQMKLNARKKFTEEFEISNYTRNMHHFIEKSLSSLKK